MINIKDFYSTNQIVEMNIVYFGGKKEWSQKQMIMRYIRRYFLSGGKEGLKAINTQTEKKPRYIVSGLDLINFIRKNNKQQIVKKHETTIITK